MRSLGKKVKVFGRGVSRRNKKGVLERMKANNNSFDFVGTILYCCTWLNVSKETV